MEITYREGLTFDNIWRFQVHTGETVHPADATLERHLEHAEIVTNDTARTRDVVR